MHELTGDARWDAGASTALGLLLAVIAFEISRAVHPAPRA
jgi:hypothetical protein